MTYGLDQVLLPVNQEAKTLLRYYLHNSFWTLLSTQIMLNSSSEEGLQGRNRLILKWYCTKIVMESAESVFIMQNASQQDENFYS